MRFFFLLTGSLVILLAASFYFRQESDLSSPFIKNAEALAGKTNPEGIRVTSPGEGIVFGIGKPFLYPGAGEDFYLSIYIKFQKLPAPGEKVFLLKRFGQDSYREAGYALAIEGERDGYRPMLYWSSGEGTGRWFSYAPVKLVEKEWIGFIMHYSRENILGLHVQQQGQLFQLGGYSFKQAVIPDTDVPLAIGAVGTGNFRGRIGAVDIYSLESEIPVLTMVKWLAGEDSVSLVLNAEDHLLSFNGRDMDTSIYKREVTIQSGKEKADSSGKDKTEPEERARKKKTRKSNG